MSKRSIFKPAALLAVFSLVLGVTAAFPAYAGASASAEPDFAPFVKDGYVYAQMDVDYADFFYGELNNTGENSTLDLGAQDPAAALRAPGYYDAVSSATVGKVARWPQVKADTSSGKTIATGVAKVTVRMEENLWNQARAAQGRGASSQNPVLELAAQIATPSSAAPANLPTEYKTINGDGSLSKMVSEKETLQPAAPPVIETGKRFGNYYLTMNLDPALSVADLMAGIMETSDGAVYGLKPIDNLWLRTNNIGIAVREFREPHGNYPAYARFADLQGKTITRITYLLKNKKDVAVDTNMFVKYLLTSGQTITAQDQVFHTAGNQVPLTFNLPGDSSFALTKVSYKGKDLVSGTDYTFDQGAKTLHMQATANTGIGEYTLLFTDSKYEDVTVKFVLSSGQPEGSIVLSNNTLRLPGGVALDKYLANITQIKVTPLNASGQEDTANAKTFTAKNLGTIFFDNTGLVKTDAAVPGRNNTSTTAFPQDGSYKLEITSTGYPAVSAVIRKPAFINNGGSGGSGSGGGSSRVARRSSSGSAGSASSPFKEWVQDARGWWVRLENGSWPASTWQKYNWGEGSSWYYFGADGYIVSGWQWINGKCYYLEPAAGKNFGHLYENTTTPDGYTVNANGEWTVNGVVQTR